MDTDTNWTRKDAWLGLLFLAVGALVALYVIVAIRNGYPALFWGLGCVLAPLFLLLGTNAIYRSLRAGARGRPHE